MSMSTKTRHKIIEKEMWSSTQFKVIKYLEESHTLNWLKGCREPWNIMLKWNWEATYVDELWDCTSSSSFESLWG